MSKAMALVVVLIFVVFCGECYGERKVGFYKGKCGLTNVEDIVQNVVETWFFTRKDLNIVAALLCMQFHDCFVKGCDASLYWMDSIVRKTAVPNRSFKGYDLIDAIKEALEIGRKWYNVETGREDGNVSLASNVDLPAPSISVSDSIKAFDSKNLSTTDMVYLLVVRSAYTLSSPDSTCEISLGGHTVRIAHCSLFQDRIYSFNNTGGPDPTMSKWLLSELMKKCPRVSLIDNIFPLDVKTPSFVDNSFFLEIQKGNGVLKIDQQIALDELTKGIVDDIVKDPNFYTKFGEAMVKFGRFDGQGEVRTSCRVVNNKPFNFGVLN